MFAKKEQKSYKSCTIAFNYKVRKDHKHIMLSSFKICVCVCYTYNLTFRIIRDCSRARLRRIILALSHHRAQLQLRSRRGEQRACTRRTLIPAAVSEDSTNPRIRRDEYLRLRPRVNPLVIKVSRRVQALGSIKSMRISDIRSDSIADVR